MVANMPNEELYPLRQVKVRLKVTEGEALYSTKPIDSPLRAAELVTKMLKEMDREYVCLANLDGRLRPISYHIVTVGVLDLCHAPIPNIFKTAILENAGSIILFHNHPTGDPAPSEPDKELTEAVVKAGNLMGIPVIDHVIVGSGTGVFYSFREKQPELFQTGASFLYQDIRSDTGHPAVSEKESVLKGLQAYRDHSTAISRPSPVKPDPAR